MLLSRRKRALEACCILVGFSSLFYLFFSSSDDGVQDNDSKGKKDLIPSQVGSIYAPDL